MRILALTILGLMVVGCGKDKTETKTQSPEEKLVGSYEAQADGGETAKLVLLKNGAFEVYENDEKEDDGKWGAVGKEVHIEAETNLTLIFRIESNGDLTMVAASSDGSRKKAPKEKTNYFQKNQITSPFIQPKSLGRRSAV